MDLKQLGENMTFDEVEAIFPEIEHLYARLYYLGEGSIVTFSDFQSTIKNGVRTRFGSAGKYLLRYMYFATKGDLVHYFKYKEQVMSLPEFTNVNLYPVVCEDIKIDDDSDSVLEKLRGKYHSKGVDQFQIKEKKLIRCRWISYKNYELLFFEHEGDYLLRGYTYYF